MSSENNYSIKAAFEEEIQQLEAQAILSPEYKRKKTLIWAVRTVLSIVLFVMFWEYQWVRWALIIYIPLNLISLFAIHGMSVILKRKIEKARNKLEELDRRMGEESDQD